jgi:hypothetical protein
MKKPFSLMEAPGGKTLFAFWILSFLILIGTPIISFFLSPADVVGSMAFSFIPTAIIFNISILLAHFIRNGAENFARAGWITLSFLVMVFVLSLSSTPQPESPNDLSVVLIYSMLTLSFPLGLVVSLLMGGVAYWAHLANWQFHQSIQGPWISITIVWLAFFIVGYIQWFKLIPYLIKKCKTYKKNTEAA